MNYYSICLVISLILTISYIYKWQNRYGIHFTLLYVFGSIANFGYWQIYESTQINQAILTNKIAYLGGCFLSLTLMMSLFSVCKINLSNRIRALLYGITIFVFGTSLTVGYSDIFYKDVHLELMDNGRYRMIKEYGFFHTIFYIMLISYLLMSFIAIIIAFKKKKEVSFKSLWLMFVVMFVNLLSFFGGRALFEDIELITISYIISEIAFLILTNRLVLYNIDKMVISSMLSEGELGIVSFDFNYNFLGCNDVAKKYYTPLDELLVDRPIDSTNLHLKTILFWLDEFKENNKFELIYQSDNKYYKVVVKYLYDNNKKRGYNLIFTDYTEEKHHEEEIIRISITDELTGLYNRRAYEKDITYIKNTNISPTFVIAAFDLNGLKKANDSLGHAAGDEIIKAAADCLKKSFKNIGKVYRTGGDEFTGLFYCTDEVLEQSMNNFDIIVSEWKGELVESMTISKGIASISEFPDYDIVQLEHEADKRMYADKDMYYIRTGLDRRTCRI